MLGIGCCPPPVGGCLLAAGQKATWMSCTLLTLSASKECKDCSCCQRVESIGLCKETNAVWADRVSRSLRIPLSYNSIWLCHCPAFLWVMLTFFYICVRKITVLNWQVMPGIHPIFAYQLCVHGLCTSTLLMSSTKAEIPTLDRITGAMGETQTCVFNNPAPKAAINACVKVMGILFPSE